MQRTLLHHRFILGPLLGVLAASAGCSDGPETFVPPPGTEPQVSPVPPPPISGGTLIITRTDTAVASDPERDQIWITLIEPDAAPVALALEKGDEPGRLVEDGNGKVHVALRSGGAIVTI